MAMEELERYFGKLSECTSYLSTMVPRWTGDVKSLTGPSAKPTNLQQDRPTWHCPCLNFKWLQIQKTVPKESVPRPAWEPGIEAGYRKPYKPWKYYFLSFFQFHNESINVWTHFFGTIIVLMSLWHYNHTLDYWNNPRAWPHLMNGICGVVCTSSSCIAHLLYSKSALAHYVTFSFDYAGAGIYGYGCCCAVIFYSSDDNLAMWLGPYFIPFVAFLAAFMCICCAVGKVKYSFHHHSRRMLMFAIPAGLIFAPPFLISMPRYLADAILNPNPDPLVAEAWRLHTYHMATFFSAAFFYLFHFPEVYFKGKFDMFFHGHQFWHVLLVCTMVLDQRAYFYEYSTRTRPPEVMARLPDYSAVFYCFVPLIIADLILIYIAAGMARRAVIEEHHEIDFVDEDNSEQDYSQKHGSSGSKGEDEHSRKLQLKTNSDKCNRNGDRRRSNRVHKRSVKS